MNAHDEEDGPHSYPLNPARSDLTPTSPPPSFRSRSASPSSRRLLQNDPYRNDDDQELADAFGDEDGSDDDEEPDDRQRLMRANPDGWAPPDHGQTVATSSSASSPESENEAQVETRAAPGIPRRQTILPSFTTPASGVNRPITASNDGVFANLAAKPERGEKNEDLPPVRALPTHCEFTNELLMWWTVI